MSALTMDTMIENLRTLALAATPGPWIRSDRPTGPFWHISSDYSIGGKRCISGRQAIGSVHAENKKNDPEYAAMFRSNADFIAAANPAAIIDLIAHIDSLTDELALTRSEVGTLRDAADHSAPTDISAQLREYAGNPGYSHNDYADVMRLAADECERFYGGMMAWKQTAKKKDAQFQAELLSATDRIAAAEKAQPVAEQASAALWIDASPGSQWRTEVQLFEDTQLVTLVGATAKFGHFTTPLCVTMRPAVAEQADALSDESGEREKFIAWSETAHRNTDPYTARDFNHGLCAWKAGRAILAARPAAAPSGDEFAWRTVDGKQHDTGRVTRNGGSFFADTARPEDAERIANALNLTARPAAPVQPSLPEGWTVAADGKWIAPAGFVATAYSAPVQPDQQEARDDFALVPRDPDTALNMGWAYLDAARAAEPGRDWAFSHAGYRAMVAAAPSPRPAPADCRNQGGVCDCRSGGSFGGCAIERASTHKHAPADDTEGGSHE